MVCLLLFLFLFFYFSLFLDTGFFSIQVLQKALEVFDIELIPYASQHPIAQQARADPQSIQAYICNLREHWLTIRKFGSQHFDLNSISTVPKLISNTYLSLYLAQLKQSGYSIFIIHGSLPPCPADERLLNNEIDPIYYRSLTDRIDVGKTDQNTNTNNKKLKNSPRSTSSFDEKEIQRAIKASVELDNAEDKALQQVLAQSLRDDPTFIHQHGEDSDILNQRLLDQAIAASLNNTTPVTESVPITTAELTVEGKMIYLEKYNLIYF
jgi:ataxin-3